MCTIPAYKGKQFLHMAVVEEIPPDQTHSFMLSRYKILWGNSVFEVSESLYCSPNPVMGWKLWRKVVNDRCLPSEPSEPPDLDTVAFFRSTL